MNLPAPGLKGLSAFSVSAVLMACIGHASALDNTIATSTHRLLIGDFNGDYAADVLAQGHRDDEHAVSLSDGAVSQRWRDGFLGLTWNRDDRTLVVGDFNGDASSDLLLQAATPTALTELVHSDTTGEVGKANQSIGDYYLGLRWDAAHRQLIVGDFNGDSRDDIFLQGKQAADRHGLALAEANGTFTALALEFADSRLNLNWSVANTGIVAGDFDGNGVSELLLQPNTSGNVLRIGNRTGLLDEIVQSLTPDAFGINWHRADHQLVVGDFNGDGSDDVFLLASRADDGSALVTGGTSGLSGISERIDGIADRDHVSQILVGDFDADGIDDLVLLFDTPDLAPLALLRTGSRAQSLDAALRQLGLLQEGQALRTQAGQRVTTTSDSSTAFGGGDLLTNADAGTAMRFSVDDSATTTSFAAVTGEGGVQAMMASTGAPPTANAVGALAGSGSVTGGAANYTIPIVLPPGRNGMQPSVSLNYSSRSGNGSVGMGWSLSAGQSSIERCAATNAQFQYLRGVQMDGSDKLCLDGQLLIWQSGIYGKTGAVYRTELESFQLITQSASLTSFTASDKFTVRRQDGSVATYAQKVVPSGAVTPVSWLLTELKDLHGNTITYNYTDYGNGEVLLTSINYTGFNSTVGDRSVVFVYEARNDNGLSYLAGGQTRQTKRLAKIQTKLSSSQIRDYTLAYDDSIPTKRSILKWVQECVTATGACLKETTFSQSNDAISYAPPAALASLASYQFDEVHQTADLDGDGIAELTGIKYGTTGRILFMDANYNVRFACDGYVSPTQRLQLDSNQDGRPEFIRDMGPSSTLKAVQSGYTPGATSCPAGTEWDLGITGGLFGPSGLNVIVEDFNGDGRTDIGVQRDVDSDPYQIEYSFKVHYGVSINASGVVQFGPATAVTYANGSAVAVAEVLGDLDGNGIADLLLYNGSTPQASQTIMFSNRGAVADFSVKKTLATLGFPDDLRTVAYRWHDLNGDGLDDLLYSKNGVWQYRLNNGKTFGAEVSTGNSDGALARNYCDKGRTNCQVRLVFGNTMQKVDWNGDGLDDLLVPVTLHGGAQSCTPFMEVDSEGLLEEIILCTPTTSNLLAPGFTYYGYMGDQGPMGSYDRYDRGIYDWKALRFSVNSSGLISAESNTTGIEATVNDSVFGDINGDGLLDVITRARVPQYSYDGGVLAFNYQYVNSPGWASSSGVYIANQTHEGTEQHLPPDMLLSAVDGFGVQDAWHYKTLSSFGSFYSIPSANRYSDSDHFYFASTMHAVDSWKTSNGIGGLSETRYSYQEAMYNRKGRGFQGFRSIVETVDRTPTQTQQTTTTFYQKFPLAGLVQSQQVKVAGVLVKSVSSTPAWRGPSMGYATPSDSAIFALRDGVGPLDDTTYLPYTKASTSSQFDLDSSAMGTSSQSTTLDSNGCTTTSVSTVSDAFLTHTTTSNVPNPASNLVSDTASWWLCKKLKETVTKTVSYTAPLGITDPLDTSKVVTTDYTWTSKRQPKTVSVGVDGSRTALTTYTYDYESGTAPCVTDAGDYGNLNCTTVSGSDATLAGVVTSRTSQAAFESTGYFPLSLKNAKGHTTTLVTDATNGQMTSATDPNGLTVTSTYDAFGRARSKQLLNTTPDTVTYGDCTTGTYNRYGVAFASAATPLPVCGNVTKAKYVITTEKPGVKPYTHTYYDALGRVVRTQTRTLGGTASIIDTEYDAYGRISRTSVPWNELGSRYWTSFTDYDALDRPLSKTLPNGEGRSGLTVSYQYNGLTTAVNVGGSKPFSITRTKNALGQWMSTTDQGDDNSSNKLTTNFRYDAAGNPVLISRTPQGGTEIRNTARYNNVGHKTTMTDPERGTWTFAYNVIGELLQQTDAKAQNTWFDYDLLGRPLARYEALTSTKPGTATASWTYDTAARDAGGANTNTYGLPATAIKAGEVSKTFSYNANAQLKQTQISLTPAGETARSWTVSQTYDSELRPATQTWPSGQLTVTNTYDSDGFLSTLKDGTHVIEHNVLADAFGNLEQQRYGYDEAIWQQSWFDDATGRITGLCSKTGSYGGSAACTGSLQALDYGNVMGNSVAYDDYGNLLKQQNYNNSVTETFTYDLRQRLNSSSRSGGGLVTPLTHTYGYDALGNLKSKTDYLNNIAATLNYGSAYGKGPHQVAEVRSSSNTLLASYTYDLNGNLTSSTDAQSSSRSRNLVYNLQMVPTSVSMGASNSSRFDYDDSNERYFEKHVDGSTTTKLWKLGKLFEQKETWVSGGKTEDVQNHYVGQHGLLKYYPTTLVRTWNFLLTDRLGSVDTVVNQSNVVQERHGYDPFGKPRTPGWDADTRHPTYSTSALLANLSQRGYTGHDHIDSVGLIHMNGRMYDPELGRFLGVDPFMQAPLNSQSLNPYSYVMNNPVMGTDPTGYVSEGNCDTSDTHGACSVKVAPTGSHIKSAPKGTDKVVKVTAVGTDKVEIVGRQTSGREYTISVKTNKEGIEKLKGAASRAQMGGGEGGVGPTAGNGGNETGFWSGLGQRFSNLATAGAFKTDQQLDEWGAGLKLADSLGPEAVAEYLRQNPAFSGTKAVVEMALAPGVLIKMVAGGGATVTLSGEAAAAVMMRNGFTADKAKDLVASFDGEITARIVNAGESFLRYTDKATSSGNFLTRTLFGSSDEASKALYLAPYGNNAMLVQTVTASRATVVLEGGVANGAQGVRQTFTLDRSAFEFGTGVAY